VSEYFNVGYCQNCGREGELRVLREVATRQLYVACDECELEWRSPAEARNDVASATHFTRSHSVAVGRDELRGHEWEQWVVE
jgi:uncharacterized Zn finger protein